MKKHDLTTQKFSRTNNIILHNNKYIKLIDFFTYFC